MHLKYLGPHRVATIHGQRFFLQQSITTVARLGYMLPHKDNVFSHIQNLLSIIHTQFSKIIKCFLSDNEPNFAIDQCMTFFSLRAFYTKRVVFRFLNKIGQQIEKLSLSKCISGTQASIRHSRQILKLLHSIRVLFDQREALIVARWTCTL